MPDTNQLNLLISDFRDALAAMNKASCVQLALDALESGEVELTVLYEKILAPTLNTMTDESADKSLYIWQEHIRSSIIRSIIEACYPHLLKILARDGIALDKGKVVIASPTDEFHELGARMGSDFFNLAGYQTIFVGANTPKSELLDGIRHEAPDYVVLNVVNYYHAFKVKTIVDEIVKAKSGVRVLGSGHAFRQDRELAGKLGMIGTIDSMDDILALGGDPE